MTIDASLLDQLAEAIHDTYVRNQLERGQLRGATTALVAWSDLTPDLQEANRAQASAIADKLESIGCTTSSTAPGAGEFEFTAAELETLSREEHDRWNRQREAAGWSYGEIRDDDAKEHPSLTSWDELPEREREKDRDAIRAIPGVLASVGLHVVRVVRAH